MPQNRFRKSTDLTLHLDAEQQLVATSLVANLVYIPLTDEMRAMGLEEVPANRIPEMGRYRITPEMLYENGMEQEATILSMIEKCIQQGKPPDEKNITALLAVKHGQEKANELFQSIMMERTIVAMIEPLSFSLGDWIQDQKLIKAMQSGLAFARGATGTYREKYDYVASLLADLIPFDLGPAAIDYLSTFNAARADASLRAEQRRQGKQTGPMFPWAALRKLVEGGLKKGDMWLISARSKWGKTTVAGEIAYDIAFNQDGYMVLMFHLETTALTLAQRNAAREFWIKPGYIREGLIDPQSPAWKPRFDAVAKDIELRCGTGRYSKYQYLHRPGLTIDQFERDVQEFKAVADAMGLELVVILDYYQEMDWKASTGAVKESDGLNQMATALKKLFELYKVYAIVFAQDSLTEDRKTPFGATKIVMRSQGHIQMTRGVDGKDEAEDDLVVMKADENGGYERDANGNPIILKDALGYDIYWHKKGQPRCELRMHLVRANEDESGYCDLRMYNGYFRIEEVIKHDLNKLLDAEGEMSLATMN